MNSHLAGLNLIVPTLILIAGVVNDIKSRKVHNYLVLILLVSSIINAYVFNGGFEGLKFGLFSFLVALAITLPLVLPKILGAGDMKLFMAFSFSVAPMATFYVLLYSFVWGALLGVARAFLSGQATLLFLNTLEIAKGGKKAVADSQLHKIPYTVALLLGWLTHLTLTGFRG
jgi:Flp pilus assembly protein protease CpaA